MLDDVLRLLLRNIRLGSFLGRRSLPGVRMEMLVSRFRRCLGLSRLPSRLRNLEA